jgi:hypothetical protein
VTRISFEEMNNVTGQLLTGNTIKFFYTEIRGIENMLKIIRDSHNSTAKVELFIG